MTVEDLSQALTEMGDGDRVEECMEASKQDPRVSILPACP